MVTADLFRICPVTVPGTLANADKQRQTAT